MVNPPIPSVDPNTNLFPANVLTALDTRVIDNRNKKLIQAQKALAVRSASSPFNVITTGDSWLEGSGSAVTLGQRMIDKFGVSLAQRFAPGTPVGGYLPATWGAPGATMTAPPAVLTGSATPELANWGLGDRDVVLSNTGTVTWSVTGRYAKLFYLQFPDQGTFDLFVDGSKVTTINTAGTANVGAFYSLDMTTDAAHTVRVSWVSGGVRVSGIQFSAANTSINVWDGAHAGSYTSLFAGSSGANHFGQAAAMNPALSIICTGLNTFYQIGIANFQADFTSVLVNARNAMPNASQLVVIQAFPNNGNSGAGGANWSQFVDIQKTVAAAQGAAVLDLGTRIASFATDTNGLWQSDGVHLNTYGQAMAADIMAQFISPV